jgi:PAS fold
MEMYGLSSDIVRPGCHLLDLLKHRIELGCISSNPEDYVATLRQNVADGNAFSRVMTLGDGRVFSIISKPLHDGGWLDTHEDITERQRSEERIAHSPRWKPYFAGITRLAD